MIEALDSLTGRKRLDARSELVERRSLEEELMDKMMDSCVIDMWAGELLAAMHWEAWRWAQMHWHLADHTGDEAASVRGHN